MFRWPGGGVPCLPTGKRSRFWFFNRDTANGTEMEIRLPYASVTVAGVRRLWSEDPMAYIVGGRTSVTLETLPRDSVTVSGGNLSLTMEPLSLYELTVTRTP
jgi:hypothetical protein